MMNEYQHWTSPVSFVFLRTFFGKTDDRFGKAFFPLHAFHLRTARLMGVRMVATDATDIRVALLSTRRRPVTQICAFFGSTISILDNIRLPRFDA